VAKPFRVVALLGAGVALLVTLTVVPAVGSDAPLRTLVVGVAVSALGCIGLFGYSVRARRSARLAGVLCLPLFVLTGFTTGPAFLLGAFLLLAGSDKSQWALGRASANA